MKLLLCLLLAASARADLTMPIVRADEKPAKPAPAASAAFGPMVGTWTGPVRCGAELETVSLKIDIDDPKQQGRAFILYTLKGASYGGYMASLILTPAGRKGVYVAHDGGGRLPDLRAEAHGRVLTLRPPLSGAADLMLQARMAFDLRWRAAAVSLRRSDGPSCAGTLRR